MHLEARADFEIQTITPALADAERVQFEVFSGPDLAVLREAYGAAAVTVHWGVIQDYS